MKEQSIAFAHYKGDKLLGYRADTMGSLSMKHPKIYTFSREQIDTVLGNIKYAYCGEKKQTLGSVLEKVGVNPDQCKLLEEAENKIYEQGQESRAFEIRVVECPSYPEEFNVEKAQNVTLWEYPVEEMAQWIQHPERHVVIETHQFTLFEQLNMQ